MAKKAGSETRIARRAELLTIHGGLARACRYQSADNLLEAFTVISSPKPGANLRVQVSCD
jgi:hypothetical protein